MQFLSRTHKEKGICYQESAFFAGGMIAELLEREQSFPGEGSAAVSLAGLKLTEDGDAVLHEV